MLVWHMMCLAGFLSSTVLVRIQASIQGSESRASGLTHVEGMDWETPNREPQEDSTNLIGIHLPESS